LLQVHPGDDVDGCGEKPEVGDAEIMTSEGPKTDHGCIISPEDITLHAVGLGNGEPLVLPDFALNFSTEAHSETSLHCEIDLQADQSSDHKEVAEDVKFLSGVDSAGGEPGLQGSCRADDIDSEMMQGPAAVVEDVDLSSQVSSMDIDIGKDTTSSSVLPGIIFFGDLK